MSEQNETVVTGGAETSSTPALAKKNTKNILWVAVVAVLVVLGALVAYQQGYFSTNSVQEDSDVTTTKDPNAVVATVNGVTITRGELDAKMAQIRKTVPDGMADPTQNAEFEYDVLDEIINLTLLVSRAEAQGLSVTDEQVQAEITSLIEVFGGEENFNTQLEVTGLTREELEKNMKNELRIRALVDAETNLNEVEVTGEEVKAAYDLAVAGSNSTSTPSLEDISEMLKAQLVQQKSAAIVDAYLENLRASADIKRSL
jgi:FKBP-type peptidyl-prolyl cis-trans isomerase (trigger factor)